MKNHILLIFLLLTGSFFIPGTMSAQDSVTGPRLLLLTNVKNHRVKFIQPEKKIWYRLKGWDASVKSRILEVKENSIVVEGREIPFDSLQKIRCKSTGLKAVQIGGYVVMASGAVVAGGGFALMAEGASNPDACAGAFEYLIGAVMFVVGGITVIVGAIPQIFTGKSFRIPEKWTVNSGYQVKKGKKKTTGSLPWELPAEMGAAY